MQVLNLDLVDFGAHGTGFPIRCGGRNWIATCQHNVENNRLEREDLSGSVDLSMLAVDSISNTLFLRKGEPRKIVGVSIDGKLADCVAIEVLPGEELAVTFDDPQAPIGISRPDDAPPSGVLAFQAVQDAQLRWDAVPVFKEVMRFRANDVVAKHGIYFKDGMGAGSSGGPLISYQDDRGALAGIYTHRLTLRIFESELSQDVGQGCHIDVLLRAIDGATGTDRQIVPIAWP